MASTVIRVIRDRALDVCCRRARGEVRGDGGEIMRAVALTVLASIIVRIWMTLDDSLVCFCSGRQREEAARLVYRLKFASSTVLGKPIRGASTIPST